MSLRLARAQGRWLQPREIELVPGSSRAAEAVKLAVDFQEKPAGSPFPRCATKPLATSARRPGTQAALPLRPTDRCTGAEERGSDAPVARLGPRWPRPTEPCSGGGSRGGRTLLPLPADRTPFLAQHPCGRGQGGEKPEPRRLGRERGCRCAEEAVRPADSPLRRGPPHPELRECCPARPAGSSSGAGRWLPPSGGRAGQGRDAAWRCAALPSPPVLNEWGSGARRETGARRPSASGRPEPCGAAGGRGRLQAGPPRCSCCGSACRCRGPTTWTPNTRCSSGGTMGPSSGTRFFSTATAKSDGESPAPTGPVLPVAPSPGPAGRGPSCCRLCPAGSWQAPPGPAGPPTPRWSAPGPFSGAGSGGTPAGGASSSSWVSRGGARAPRPRR